MDNDGEVIPEKYAKYLTDDNNWGISPDMLTDQPHPYSTGKCQIEIPAGMHDKAQAKALACGFRWTSGCEWYMAFSESYLIIDDGIMLQDYELNENHILLTFDQFMEGYVPDVVDKTDIKPIMDEKESTYVAESKKRVEETGKKEQKYFCVCYHDEVKQVIPNAGKLLKEYYIIERETEIAPYRNKINIFSEFTPEKIHNCIEYGFKLITFDEFQSRFKPSELAKYEGKAFAFEGEDLTQGITIYGTCKVVKGVVTIYDVELRHITTEAQYIQLYELLTGKEFKEEDLK
jgi:hypothetical protein